ncbi:MAG: hypothetical protein IPK16_12655 [Anaerolineales bacterium]|nr:hypothetical protein [Anaerolineales bacterium]
MNPRGSFRYPFGDVSCEYEFKALQENYPDYFYSLGRYTREAIDEDHYLIVGRRGSGKTSLTRYFHFQNAIRSARCIDVNEPDIYDMVYQHVADQMAYVDRQLKTVAIGNAAKLWHFVIWSLIFNEYDHAIVHQHAPGLAPGALEHTALEQKQAIAAQFRRFAGVAKNEMAKRIEAYLTSDEFCQAQRSVMQDTRRQPLIVAIDSLEKYDKNDDAMMATTAALIQCASDFNVEYVQDGIHVKAFVAAEIFPHLKEQVVLNTAKYVRDPVYLHWWPRDLVHLVSWRFWKFLTSTTTLAPIPPGSVKWANFDSVLETLWYPYFGTSLTNRTGFSERTFPYLLRHTQMRPRQFVQLCNAIAKQARHDGYGIEYSRVDIPEVVKRVELELADEVIGSYSEIYPQVSAVVDALDELPVTFQGNELDKVARTTRAAWSRSNYSLEAFRTLVAELGIVGKVRHRDRNGLYILGDFEYMMTDRLTLDSEDECVIHPMFFGKLHTRMTERVIVLPFPNHADFGADYIRWMNPNVEPPKRPASNGEAKHGEAKHGETKHGRSEGRRVRKSAGSAPGCL